MNSGYIKIHRELLSWQWYDTPNMVHMLLHCILKANYQDKKWHEVTVKRGQFITSLQKMAVSTGLTVQQVRTCMGRLENCGEVTSQSTNRFTIYTVVKYEKFQMVPEELTSELTNKQQTDNKQTTTTKESKEYKERKEKKEGKSIGYSDQFEEFWKEYPSVKVLKGSKPAANSAFIKALQEIDYGRIQENLRAYARYCRETGAYTCHASKWLNQKYWESDWTIPTTASIPTANSIAEDIIAKREAEFDKRQQGGGDPVDEDVEPMLEHSEEVRSRIEHI